MKILVFADTHGETSAAQRIIENERPDQIFHLGDCVRDAEELERCFPTLPICTVPGNNDWFSQEQTEKIVCVEGFRIFLCHGHTTKVKHTLSAQWLKAKNAGCRLSLFGHTHSPYQEEREGVLLFNPGSLTYGGTYGRICLCRDEALKAEILYDR